MSVSKRVSAAMDAMGKEDADEALFQICAAVEATAKAEGHTGGSGYRDFLRNHLGLITKTALGPAILNLRIEYSHPEIKSAPDGTCSLEQILYHAVRCGLYHSSSLPTNLRFTDKQRISNDQGVLVLPSSIVDGLIVAVVVSPVNTAEKVPERYAVSVRGHLIPVNKLWGKRTELLNLYQAMEAF